MIKVTRVMTKARKQFGIVYASAPTEFSIETDTASGDITILRDKNGVTERCKTFNVGCEAEYDSYNLSYTGTIIKITDKAVTIREGKHKGARIHRLDLSTFCWRNYDFDAAETALKNSDTMMYI